MGRNTKFGFHLQYERKLDCPREDDLLVVKQFLTLVLYFGSIRMNILMLDTRNVEQTKDVRMHT